MKKTVFRGMATALAIVMLVMCLASCSVSVDQIILNKTSVTLKEEETFTFTSTIIPSDAINKELTWQSTDNSVAVVDSYGTVTAITSGTCMIIASADGKTATANITVNPKGPNFKALYEGLSSNYGWTLGSDNSYLSADTNIYDMDDYSNSSIMYAIRDMNKEIGLPDSLYNDMLSTTWSMGKQTETYESFGLTVSWTYHPDKGLEVTYRLINR